MHIANKKSHTTAVSHADTVDSHSTAKTTTYKHATRHIQDIHTNDSPPTQTGTEEQGEAAMHMEIGWQQPEVFPGGSPPQY